MSKTVIRSSAPAHGGEKNVSIAGQEAGLSSFSSLVKAVSSFVKRVFDQIKRLFSCLFCCSKFSQQAQPSEGKVVELTPSASSPSQSSAQPSHSQKDSPGEHEKPGQGVLSSIAKQEISNGPDVQSNRQKTNSGNSPGGSKSNQAGRAPGESRSPQPLPASNTPPSNLPLSGNCSTSARGSATPSVDRAIKFAKPPKDSSAMEGHLEIEESFEKPEVRETTSGKRECMTPKGLRDAVKDIKSVKALLSFVRNPNIADIYGTTLLHVAEDPEVVDFLLEQKEINLNLRNHVRLLDRVPLKTELVEASTPIERAVRLFSQQGSLFQESKIRKLLDRIDSSVVGYLNLGLFTGSMFTFYESAELRRTRLAEKVLELTNQKTSLVEEKRLTFLEALAKEDEQIGERFYLLFEELVNKNVCRVRNCFVSLCKREINSDCEKLVVIGRLEQMLSQEIVEASLKDILLICNKLDLVYLEVGASEESRKEHSIRNEKAFAITKMALSKLENFSIDVRKIIFVSLLSKKRLEWPKRMIDWLREEKGVEPSRDEQEAIRKTLCESLQKKRISPVLELLDETYEQTKSRISYKARRIKYIELLLGKGGLSDEQIREQHREDIASKIRLIARMIRAGHPWDFTLNLLKAHKQVLALSPEGGEMAFEALARKLGWTEVVQAIEEVRAEP